MTEQDLVIQELRAENAKLKERLEEQSKPTEPTDMDKITTEMMEHICDNLCMHPIRVGQTQDELDDICAECKMGKFVCDILNTYNRLNDFDKTQSYDLLKKLSEYRNLEEQGLLLKLPCKVGETVFCIYSRWTKCSAYNEEKDEYRCQGCECACDSRKEKYISEQRAYSLDWIITNLKAFGKTVFLTEQEAQAALEKMKGDKV